MADQSTIIRLRTYIAQQGISITDERPINYGYQLKLEYGSERATINLFTSGTVQIQAKPGSLQALLEAWRGQGATAVRRERQGSTAEAGLLAPLPHIGGDESGKGDYFGPLTVAAVALDEPTAKRLAALGVRDSKQLEDPQIARLAERIQAICPHVVMALMPERYNQRYAESGSNLNRLLARCHAHVIGQLLERTPFTPKLALVDQFGDERLLEEALRARSCSIALRQQPRAEADLAVAAASLLARASFAERLKQLSRDFGVVLPPGASDTEAIVRAGRRLLALGGQEALGRAAKLHFKTTKLLTDS